MYDIMQSKVNTKTTPISLCAIYKIGKVINLYVGKRFTLIPRHTRHVDYSKEEWTVSKRHRYCLLNLN